MWEVHMLSFCKKCGRTLQGIFELETTCDVCGSETYEVPRKYIDNFRWRDGDGKQALIEELVKTSQEFDQYLFDHKDEILSKQSAEFNAKMEHGKAILEEQSRVPKCTYCGSTNIRKIGLLNRAISTELWGLSSKKIGKQFHCNHCGADF